VVRSGAPEGVHFGKFLKELRLRAGMGLRRFAELVDLKPSNLSAIETGRREPPADPAKLREIADAVGLVEGSDEWAKFFEAARRAGQLPADIRHMADRGLVPVLLRTVDNRRLSDDEIAELIQEIEQRHGRQANSSAPDVHSGGAGA